MRIQDKKISLFLHMKQITDNIIKVAYTFSADEPKASILVSDESNIADEFNSASVLVDKFCFNKGDKISFKNNSGEIILEEICHNMIEKKVYKYCVDGEPVIKYKQTANGEVAFVENIKQVNAGIAYEGKLIFKVSEDESVYGLGQNENGEYNYNGKKEYLFQSNMKISIPFIISSKNYGLLIDTESSVIFDSKNSNITFTIDTTNELSYYVITGKDFEEIIRSLRNLTGRTPMFPRWIYGYLQSKERYNSSEELIEIAKKFRQNRIPVDCIVQDWLTWKEGMWGDKNVDTERFPDLVQLVNSLHEERVKLMVSIWPNMRGEGKDLKEFREKKLLLPNSTTYDAFNEKARDLYWKQCEQQWFSAGVDAWWCDNAEPFSDADWNGKTKRTDEDRYSIITEESRKSMDWTRINSYGLFHSKGIYENWRKTDNKKRVTNLIRSTYTSGQKYGVIPWSGDISAKWSTLKKQITEGINFSLSGMPYWTLDIGGFFVVKDKWKNRGCNCSDNTDTLWFWDGDYNEGVNDLGYRELYVRWLQYATFLPVFRSHGTDTPREPWNFGELGDNFYDTIVKFIKIRYKLLPYIYSMAADVFFNHFTILRSLMFDFPGDEKIKEIKDCFMFGKALLVCPVTEPMYYEAESVQISNIEKTRELYLPKDIYWYDLWTNNRYTGGQTIKFPAGLETIPVFVKEGSILPLSDQLMYADEKEGEISEILIYSGSDGEFTLYNDEGDNYSYEEGNFSLIRLTYEDSRKILKFEKASGNFKYQEKYRIRLIEDNVFSKVTDFIYKGEEESVCFDAIKSIRERNAF